MNFNVSKLVYSLIFNSFFSKRLSLAHQFEHLSRFVSFAKICIDMYIYLQREGKVFLSGAIPK